MVIRKFPPILTFALSRFEMNWATGDRKKLNDKFTFPLELDVTPYMEFPKDSPENLYELKAIVIHSGGAYGGHYHAYIHDELEEGNWDIKIPEKYASEPKKEITMVNVGIAKSMEENPVKLATMKPTEKEEELSKKVQEISLNFDDCDFPAPYTNPNLRKNWFDFDDSKVTPIPLGRLRRQFGSLTESAYILIYKQRVLKWKFFDPRQVPEPWVESVILQNDLYQQQRDFYKEEEGKIEIILQHADLFNFDEEGMIKYKVDKGIEDQGHKIKLAKISSVSQCVDIICNNLKTKLNKPVTIDTYNIYQIERRANEYCHIIRNFPTNMPNEILEKVQINHGTTWIFCEKDDPRSKILQRACGEDSWPIEICVRFYGEDLVFHTYRGITLKELKQILYEKTSFPVDQQKIEYLQSAAEHILINDKIINENGKEITLADLKFTPHTQLMLDVFFLAFFP